MARLARGTVVEITKAHFLADQDLKALQSHSISNPNSSIVNDPQMAQLEKQRNRSWRAATGSIATLMVCRCGYVNPHLTDGLVTECCASRNLTVQA